MNQLLVLFAFLSFASIISAQIREAQGTKEVQSDQAANVGSNPDRGSANAPITTALPTIPTPLAITTPVPTPGVGGYGGIDGPQPGIPLPQPNQPGAAGSGKLPGQF